MRRLGLVFLSCSLVIGTAIAQPQAQTPVPTSGTLVIVPAFGEVKHVNDEVRITFMVEEQDRDKAAAASRVNQKMKQGLEIIKREDPQATFKTRGYYTHPVYPDDQPRPTSKLRQPAGWRVGHYLDVTTANLGRLPKTVAAAQQILALNGLQFGLKEETARKLDQQRIEAAYRNLSERIAAIAKVMGRNLSEAVLDTVDFEASGAYAPQSAPASQMTMRATAGMESAPVEEPSFEPGETTLQLRVVGKVKFK